jgi:hypothetical protein
METIRNAATAAASLVGLGGTEENRGKHQLRVGEVSSGSRKYRHQD